VQRALEGLDGVESVAMRFDDREFDVVHAERVTPEDLIEVVVAKGFSASMVPDESNKDGE